MTKKGVKLFFRFLKEQGIFSNYLTALRECKNNTCAFFYKHNKNPKTFFNDKEIDDLSILQYSFYWAESREGDSFWRNKNEEYYNLYYHKDIYL